MTFPSKRNTRHGTDGNAKNGFWLLTTATGRKEEGNGVTHHEFTDLLIGFCYVLSCGKRDIEGGQRAFGARTVGLVWRRLTEWRASGRIVTAVSGARWPRPEYESRKRQTGWTVEERKAKTGWRNFADRDNGLRMKHQLIVLIRRPLLSSW